MFRRIWNALFGGRPKSVVVKLSPEDIPNRRASSVEIAGLEPEPTGFDKAPSETLIAICDAYWNSFLEESTESPEDAFSPSSVREYNQYVNAVNELGNRGPEIREWAIAHLRHPGYDAREQAAWLVGALGSKDQLGEDQSKAIDELTWLATRPIEDDNKEAQANSAALTALGKIGDARAIPALRHILTAREWEQDELPWEAAEVLGQLVGESFMDREHPEMAAKLWLQRHPGNSA